MLSISKRFKIVGIETIMVGGFLLLAFALNHMGSSFGRLLPSIDADFPIISGALVLVGFEIFSLIRKLAL